MLVHVQRWAPQDRDGQKQVLLPAVLNGELHRGAHGAAGEFFGDDRTRPWVGTNAEIRSHARERSLTFTDVFAAARSKRGPARTLVTRYAADIAELVRELLVLDPPVIVVGGEVVKRRRRVHGRVPQGAHPGPVQRYQDRLLRSRSGLPSRRRAPGRRGLDGSKLFHV